MDDDFEAACVEENAFDAARAEKSSARTRLQRAGNLANHATGTAKEREEYKAEGNAAGNRTQPARNHVKQATGEFKTISGGG